MVHKMRTGGYSSVYFSIPKAYRYERIFEHDSFTEKTMRFFNSKFRDFSWIIL